MNTFWFSHRHIINQIRCDHTALDKNGKPLNGKFAGIHQISHNDKEIWGVIETDRGTFKKFRYTTKGKRLTYPHEHKTLKNALK